MTLRKALPLLAALFSATSLLLPSAAPANIFGTQPIDISVGPHGEGANGTSGHATISGDDRKARFVAFDSYASNLVGHDGNGVEDVFVWGRPHGTAGVTLSRPARPSGSMARASVSSSGAEGNGPSSSPALDGSMHSSPHCVAFQSNASNLSRADGDSVSDVFVRDLRSHKTRLVSRGIGAPAGNPTLDGSCHVAAFEAGGQVYMARIKGNRAPRALGGGSNPSFSRDGSALVWTDGSAVKLRANGRTVTVAGSGSNPSVSDLTEGYWGVVFQTASRLTGNDNNPGTDVYMRRVGRSGGVVGTDLISATHRGGESLGGSNLPGGISAYGASRGIITFANAVGASNTLYYRNNHTGHIDDLAHTWGGSIFEVATSARANFVAFSSTYSRFRYDRNGGRQDVFFKALVDGQAL
jgi:hypothetical protein